MNSNSFCWNLNLVPLTPFSVPCYHPHPTVWYIAIYKVQKVFELHVCRDQLYLLLKYMLYLSIFHNTHVVDICHFFCFVKSELNFFLSGTNVLDLIQSWTFHDTEKVAYPLKLPLVSFLSLGKKQIIISDVYFQGGYKIGTAQSSSPPT